MSYEPTIWRTGDTVTAEKLNKIEQAIATDNTAIEGKVGRDEFDTEIATLESKVGSPLIASTVSEMTETDRVYVYTGSETGYTSGNWYYYDGTAWTSGGVYNAVAIETDTTLSVSGKAADAKKVGDELADVKEDLNSIEDTIEGLETGLSNDAKNALLACFRHVAWVDEHGQDYYDALEDALYTSGKVLVSISAVFDQGQNVIYANDPLDVLRQYLVVLAHYDDGSQSAVTGYTLSGTLAEGISVITVTYEGKTSTFSVTVTDAKFSEEWSYPNGNLATQIGSIQRDANSHAAIKTEQVARQSLGAANGTLALNDLSGNPLNIYPIPVPAQANNVRCTFDSSVSSMTLQVMRLEKVEDYYSLSFGTWVESGTNVVLANVTANTHIGIVFQTASSTSARIDSAMVVFTHE